MTFKTRISGLACLAWTVLFATSAYAIPVAGGLGSCALPGEAPRDCYFPFSGGRGADVVDSGVTAGPAPLPQYFVLPGFSMPRLEATRPAGDNWASLFVTQSAGVDFLGDWSDPVFIFDGFIDRSGNLNDAPEIDDDMVYWNGFAWHWEATCQAAQGTKCGRLDVNSSITFKDVRIGETQSVPAPGTFALVGLSLLCLGWMRRKP